MAYTPTNWQTGDKITQEKMNKLENGLAEVSRTAGTPGPKGEPGSDGKSAYQIAVDNGFTGSESEWLASLKGAKGDTGATGATGQKGDPGGKGDKGDKGDTGATGPAGADGLTTAISVNGTTYTQVDGTITLPNYPTVKSGVDSFKGRTGAVVPASGDYTADMVGAASLEQLAQSQSTSKSYVDGQIADVRQQIADITPESIDAVSSTTVSAIAAMTQAEYDALTEKVATVLYVIKE